MAKIMGNIVGLPSPRSDWSQTNETKADFIKNKPTKVSQFQNDAGYINEKIFFGWLNGHLNEANPHELDASMVGAYSTEEVDAAFATVDADISKIQADIGDMDTALDSILAMQTSYIGGDSE